jgi:SAM-dependent methyltransferase
MKNDTNILLSSKLIRKISTIDITKGYKEVFDIDVSRYFDGIDCISIYENKENGYKFFYPFNIAGDSKFYEKLQPYDWYYRADKWEFNSARKIITSGKLLEIGCGKGDFLISLEEKVDLEMIGVEHNLEAIKYCQSKNLNVDCYDLTLLNSNEFDFVVSFQVLEHLWDIEDFFKNSIRLLNSRGKLVIGVPNTDSFIFSPFSSNYYKNGSLLLNLPPHHMGWWNKESIEKIGKKHGLKLIDLQVEPIQEFRSQHITENIGVYFKSRIFGKLIGKFFGSKYHHFLQGETMLAVFVKQ